MSVFCKKMTYLNFRWFKFSRMHCVIWSWPLLLTQSSICRKNMLQLLLAKLVGWGKTSSFWMWLCIPHITSLACSKCQDVCEKANEWKIWLKMAETHLIASWVHQVCASDSFSRAFSCCFCPMSYVRLAEKDGLPQQLSGHLTASPSPRHL